MAIILKNIMNAAGVSVSTPMTYTPPTPTPANFGDVLDGGYYAGMIWNQVARCGETHSLTTGPKVFVLSDSELTGLAYPGQMLEIRSRNTPTSKFICTVVSLSGNTLQVNVTSVNGTGSLSDWSVMSRFRVVVSPKLYGENPAVRLKNTNSLLPSLSMTASEGWRSTQAMRNADTATVYPAAHWASNLSINGYTDWYIPSRDELELCWRNLKPTTDANFLTSRSITAGQYKTNGSYGDADAAQGVNLNSYPQGGAYTASIPGQTADSKFRTGGSEAFTYGAERFWTSSEKSITAAWFQIWHAEQPGVQSVYQSDKTILRRVRAVRRSII